LFIVYYVPPYTANIKIAILQKCNVVSAFNVVENLGFGATY
jgi:hypothetical protein